jgi:hypothetical protein
VVKSLAACLPTCLLVCSLCLQELSFLHIKGTSPLRHTHQLLRCWASNPELPRLTIVGAFAWEEVKTYGDMLNIQFLPLVSLSENDSCASFRTCMGQALHHCTPSPLKAYSLELHTKHDRQ